MFQALESTLNPGRRKAFPTVGITMLFVQKQIDANPLWKRKNLLFKHPMLMGITSLRECGVWSTASSTCGHHCSERDSVEVRAQHPALTEITALRETVWRLGHTVYSVKA